MELACPLQAMGLLNLLCNVVQHMVGKVSLVIVVWSSAVLRAPFKDVLIPLSLADLPRSNVNRTGWDATLQPSMSVGQLRLDLAQGGPTKLAGLGNVSGLK
jgi:hypothetical protein